MENIEATDPRLLILASMIDRALRASAPEAFSLRNARRWSNHSKRPPSRSSDAYESHFDGRFNIFEASKHVLSDMKPLLLLVD